MKTNIFLTAFLVLGMILSHGQDTTSYKLRLKVPVVDLPQNSELPYHYPSMGQAMEFSKDFYEVSFWGIDELGDAIFISKNKPYKPWKKFTNHAFKYLTSLAFSKYGSELPIPLGVWAHEEFHRSVLGVRDVPSENGNWLFSRWDGTVYGVSDSTLSDLKINAPDQLLYSYVSGVQYEIMLNRETTLNDFYFKRSLNKNALLLYNAWYVYDYFRFADGPDSDSVKVLAPPHESSDPSERDYAGNDLTAWIYDMFSPDDPYTARDTFPGGDGVNRRIGNSDLTPEGQAYLHKQRNLSLLNFLNPAIFFVNRININDNLSFNLFTQFAPTHFGHDIAVFLPVKYRNLDLLLDVHTYSNYSKTGLGIGLGLFNHDFTDKFSSDFTLNVWNQPESFFEESMVFGGSAEITTRYDFHKNFSAYASLSGKTKGWFMGSPYLKENISVELGLEFSLAGDKKHR